MTINRDQLRKAAQETSTSTGKALRQEFRLQDGKWWLFTLGAPARPLRDEEVEWHTARKHAPFVENGILPNDPRWWKEPER